MISIAKMTITEAHQHLVAQLNTLYDSREASAIANIIIEHITGKTRSERIISKNILLSEKEEKHLYLSIKKLLEHQPVQYITNEAWFAGLNFYVDENVLIPRPETEELVEWCVAEILDSKTQIQNIIDIGTGSGCIPISIKHKLPHSNITAIDISKEALTVAERNASRLNVEINFSQIDISNELSRKSLPVFDYIISNPPYICQSEKITMHKNVLEHEPHSALFVPDDDALIFYKAIIQFAKNHLHVKGEIFLELNEALGKETALLFQENNYDVILKKDMQGKDRMLMATKSLL